VTIKPEGDVVSGTIMANHIVLEGQASGGLLQAFRWLELRSSTSFEPERMTSARLLIGPDAHLILPEVRYHEITVQGTLKARVYATGLVRIMDGGRVEGEIHGSQLTVDEGGSLRAEVEMRPQGKPPAAAEADLPLGKTA
jgi:cytoskeletal protein CcmA (bactofilin family)